MQFHLTKAAAAMATVIATAGFISACGGDNGTQNTTPSTSVQYAGRVTDQNGVALANVSVRLENRTTDQTTEVLTSADGSFSTPVEKGVYDIIFDDKNSTGYTSLQLLATDLQSDEKSDVQLQSARNIAVNLLSGTVTNTAGIPNASRKLLILPTIARAPAGTGSAEVPAPFIVQTDAQGHFSRALGSMGMDFDFDVLVLAANAPELDLSPLADDHVFASEEAQTEYLQKLQDYLTAHVEESIDIEKPNGAMQLKLVTGSAVRNLRTSTGMSSVVPADAQQLAKLESAASTMTASASLQGLWTTAKQHAESTFLGLIPSAQAGTLLRKFLFFPDAINKDGKVTAGEFSDGKIDISSTCKHNSLNELNDWSYGHAHYLNEDFANNTSICLTKTHGFSMVVYSYEIRLKTLKSGIYKFTDESQDTYSLRVYNPKPKLTGIEHIVRYNSKAPAIIAIRYQLT